MLYIIFLIIQYYIFFITIRIIVSLNYEFTMSFPCVALSHLPILQF